MHVLELRSSALCLSAQIAIEAGDGIVMSDVARGSSVHGTSPQPFVEHRGRCPPGWQLELLLTCACTEPLELRDRLRAVAKTLRTEQNAARLGPTLADGAPLRVDPSTFREHPLLRAQYEAWRAQHTMSAGAPDGGEAAAVTSAVVAEPLPVPVAVPVTAPRQATATAVAGKWPPVAIAQPVLDTQTPRLTVGVGPLVVGSDEVCAAASADGVAHSHTQPSASPLPVAVPIAVSIPVLE